MNQSIVFECEKNISPDCWGILYLSRANCDIIQDWHYSEDNGLTYCLICPDCMKVIKLEKLKDKLRSIEFSPSKLEFVDEGPENEIIREW